MYEWRGISSYTGWVVFEVAILWDCSSVLGTRPTRFPSSSSLKRDGGPQRVSVGLAGTTSHIGQMIDFRSLLPVFPFPFGTVSLFFFLRFSLLEVYDVLELGLTGYLVPGLFY